MTSTSPTDEPCQHCDRCHRPLPHTDAERAACPPADHHDPMGAAAVSEGKSVQRVRSRPARQVNLEEAGIDPQAFTTITGEPMHSDARRVAERAARVIADLCKEIDMLTAALYAADAHCEPQR